MEASWLDWTMATIGIISSLILIAVLLIALFARRK